MTKLRAAAELLLLLLLAAGATARCTAAAASASPRASLRLPPAACPCKHEQKNLPIAILTSGWHAHCTRATALTWCQAGWRQRRKWRRGTLQLSLPSSMSGPSTWLALQR